MTQGTNDFHAAFAALERLAAAAADPAWTADAGNQMGITLDVEHAFEVTPGFASHRVERTPTGCCVEAVWNGTEENLACIDRSVFALLGELHERSCFVSREALQDELVFRVISGCTTGEMRHGHVVIIRVRGTRVRLILEQARKAANEFAALPRDAEGRPILRL